MGFNLYRLPVKDGKPCFESFFYNKHQVTYRLEIDMDTNWFIPVHPGSPHFIKAAVQVLVLSTSAQSTTYQAQPL